MKNVTTYLILLAVLYGGVLLLYRYSLNSNDLIKIDGKISGKKIEPITSHKGSNRYGLILELENAQEKYGIYLGTNSEIDNSNDLINLIDTGKTYTLLIDPTVSSTNEVRLGIREIYFNGKQVFKESNKFELVAGIFLTLLGVGGLILISRSKRR